MSEFWMNVWEALASIGVPVVVAAIGIIAVLIANNSKQKQIKESLSREHESISKEHIAISKEHAVNRELSTREHASIQKYLESLNASANALEKESAAEKERWKRLFNDNQLEPRRVIDQIIAMSEKINALQNDNQRLEKEVATLNRQLEKKDGNRDRSDNWNMER